MKSDLGKRGALRAACLIAVMICVIFSTRVQAAEEGGMTLPSSAKIYKSMSEGSDIIANLIVGNVFEVLEAENDPSGVIWYRVRTDFGAEGYVKAVEMDKLILDAQTMLSPTAIDAGVEDPVPAEDNAGEGAAPEDDNAGEEPVQEDNNAGEEPVQEDNNAGEEPVQEGNNAGVEQAPGDNNIGDEHAEDADGEEQAAENSVGEEPFFEEAAPENVAISESDSIEGAGFGKTTDSQNADSATIGSEDFTVIERTDKAKVHRHGRIDAVLIMIIAGGILCIIAIAALLKRIMKCVGTEA